MSAAARFEQQERWRSALSNYQAVLQRDANQVGAKVGRIRTQARLDLHTAIDNILQDPLALSLGSERERANKLLLDARTINNRGKLLTQQISDLENALKQADLTIKVALVSDSLTQVSLKKAGAKRIELGRFQSKNLGLKPGRYTLIGKRLGFHDVRKAVELMPNSTGVQSFRIACEQLVADAG